MSAANESRQYFNKIWSFVNIDWPQQNQEQVFLGLFIDLESVVCKLCNDVKHMETKKNK